MEWSSDNTYVQQHGSSAPLKECRLTPVTYCVLWYFKKFFTTPSRVIFKMSTNQHFILWPSPTGFCFFASHSSQLFDTKIVIWNAISSITSDLSTWLVHRRSIQEKGKQRTKISSLKSRAQTHWSKGCMRLILISHTTWQDLKFDWLEVDWLEFPFNCSFFGAKNAKITVEKMRSTSLDTQLSMKPKSDTQAQAFGLSA